MLNCEHFYQLLQERGISFFTGVPDSLLEDFLAYVTDHAQPGSHVITANEGNAIALAAGHHLATGKCGMVYMQNSGLGNAVNPLTSLMDPEVYRIPVLLFIGWRGEPGVHDEPQHVKQGRITENLLRTLGIPYEILPADNIEAQDVLDKAVSFLKKESSPFAILVSKKTFAPYQRVTKGAEQYILSREEAIHLVADCLSPHDVVVSTTGKISRELFEYRETRHQDHSRDFLTVGSMGHSSQIALGIAMARPQISVFCFDGDGALLMHLGALAIVGDQAPKNFKHIVFNNGAHDSVGGQPTVGLLTDFPAIAKNCRYTFADVATTADQVVQKMAQLQKTPGPALLEIRVKKGARSDLGRPTTSTFDNKTAFSQFVRS